MSLTTSSSMRSVATDELPLEGVEILLDIEKSAKQIPQNITAEMVVDNSLADEALKELGR